jgi:hypothetical protein
MLRANMNDLRTVDSIIAALSQPNCQLLEAPTYHGNEQDGRNRIGLAVESMKRHMTDEGWVLMEGLETAGWKLRGHNLPYNLTDVTEILRLDDPGTLLLQDKREWEGLTADRSRDPAMRFTHVEELKARPDIFKGTVLKDAQARPEYHRESADEIGCHFWVVYYHPRIVKHLAPYVREEHLIRTHHSVDASKCISSLEKIGLRKTENRCLLSGAVSSAYPLRTRLFRESHLIPGCQVLRHPGYHRDGCQTPEYLRTLNGCKVSICTSSIYGYCLRKIIESVACSCAVVTDLPVDEVLPEIDECLIRVPSSIPTKEIAGIAQKCYDVWDPAKQSHYANLAKSRYDWKEVGRRLSDDIEAMRLSYNG